METKQDGNTSISHVDVLVVGGGPVGLLTAYQLALFSRSPPAHPYSVRIVEQHPLALQRNHGRAITLFPRRAELLDSVGLAEPLAQQCFACRETASYDANGEEVEGRGWEFMRTMGEGKTKWDFAMVVRQRWQEEVYREALLKKGVVVENGVKVVDVRVEEGVREGGYKVLAVLEDTQGRIERARCKFLVGADGGRSSVRRILGVPFDGASTEDQWVRIDGIVKTNVPKSRAYVALESPTHGNVLWAPLDRGATRIGFAFTPERQKAYAEFNEAAAVKEAKAAVKPFDLEFEEVHWHTIYTVAQRVSRTFSIANCVFLAGDACHTHSSGAAQGLNTGIHDAFNLAWKMALVLKALVKPSLLRTYETERRPNVEKLINYDKDISRLMTMQLPENWTGDVNADPNQILGKLLADAASFSSGLSISYSVEASNPLIHDGSGAIVPGGARPGQRTPDVVLQKPGTFQNTRLQAETTNRGRFHILLFTGSISPGLHKPTMFMKHGFANTEHRSGVLQKNLTVDDSLPVDWLTIIVGVWPSAYERLGGQPLGKVFYDRDGSAHSQLSTHTVENGLIVVLRPDGWIGALLKLDDAGIVALRSYFDRIFRRPQHLKL
ncbi:MAG: hypothetical protein M1820_003520 [Bogoriella megaspora]|nr:MAG: hypothetical protein M1820_003520 [Bogoriella megaspora]